MLLRCVYTVLAGVILASLGMPQNAMARPDLRQMTCAQAQQMVQNRGSVVFTTGPHTYSRFVSNLLYCDRGQQVYTQYGPTRDNRKCPVAFECKEPLFERRGGIIW